MDVSKLSSEGDMEKLWGTIMWGDVGALLLLPYFNNSKLVLISTSYSIIRVGPYVILGMSEFI